jgi:hypothetical protein
VVVHGSAAEARLRPTSDLNVMRRPGALRARKIDDVREAARLAKVLVRLESMGVLASEIDEREGAA